MMHQSKFINPAHSEYQMITKITFILFSLSWKQGVGKGVKFTKQMNNCINIQLI